MAGGVEKRKAERLPGRFRVIVREKLASWVTRTEDVSARGCRIALKRPLTPGMLVQVVFDMGPGAEPLVAHGQVAWARKSPPHSAGITFLSAPRQPKETGQTEAWIDRLLRAYIRAMDEASNDAFASPPEPGSPAIVGRVRPCTVIVPPAP